MATIASDGRPWFRFGKFEVDLRTKELRKGGTKLRLTGQPFEVLTILLEHAGQMVTREELQARLWPDTFVDVEHNLNTAIKKIREALGDSAESPLFIETLPRRGYRFIAPVDGLRQVEQDTGSGLAAIAKPQSKSHRFTYRGVAIGLGLLLLALGTGLFYSKKSLGPVTSPSEYTQITNFNDSAIAPSFSPDGRMLTFRRGEDSLAGSGQIYLKMLPNGESIRLTNDTHNHYAPAFTPDSSRITYSDVSRIGQSLAWDTWIVPVFGGQPTRFLPNASGLTWTTDQRILFAEIKTGMHMGIVTATESRMERREIYFPANESAMAHFAYASPDNKSVLVVEMDQTHAFHLPCRLVPFDGSSVGREVGPKGTCTAAAWSPDGTWMYFGVMVGVNSHLWRQEFPDGAPEQITFGPTNEEGIAVAPDGRSLVTSVGTLRSAVWIHDAAGERSVSSEGYATAPRLSRDGTRVFYLFAQDLELSATGWKSSSSELRSVDLSSGRTEHVLPGVSVTDYDISRDEKGVTFTTKDRAGESQIWLASLDRSKPATLIARAGDQVSFTSDGNLVFRSLEGKTNWLVRIRKDGRERERVTTVPVLEKLGVSPDGKWVIVVSPGVGEGASYSMLAVPVHGGAAKMICTCSSAGWSFDGRAFYIESAKSGETLGKTLAIPVRSGKSLPDLPVDFAANAVARNSARWLEQVSVSPGANPSIYVFTKRDPQRNLFRIPVH
jgi:DNA-binding winged helix-turn-helix (wHTH) protein/Tol biopolymer transport system component